MKKVISLLVYVIASTVADQHLNGEANCPTIVTKQQWGGSKAVHVPYQIIPVQNVIIHHTVTSTCSTKPSCASVIENIQNYHMTDLNYDDIGYNFLIGNDGRVYQGAGWHVEGAHTYHWNKKSIGIAFIGDFSSELPASSAIKVAKNLIKCGVATGEIDENYKLYGAKQIVPSQSPGLELYAEIQNWDNWSSTL